MIVRIPLIEQAKKDVALSDSAVRLLLFLEDRLDLLEYRPVKHVSLSQETGKKVRTVHFALHQLERHRYILPGFLDPQAPREARKTRPTWYRLPYSRAP